MYQEILYEIVIFDHILGEGGWYMNIYSRILLRPERSSAARRCACFFKSYGQNSVRNCVKIRTSIVGLPRVILLCPVCLYLSKRKQLIFVSPKSRSYSLIITWWSLMAELNIPFPILNYSCRTEVG